MDEASGESRVKLHLSFFELLGNEATDLLASYKSPDKEDEVIKENDKDKKTSLKQRTATKSSSVSEKVIASKDRPGKVDIMEDKFGRINVVGAAEVPIKTPENFVELVTSALAHRRTQTTFKNDTSSRSHAICAIRVENVHLREAEDGKIFIIGNLGLMT